MGEDSESSNKPRGMLFSSRSLLKEEESEHHAKTSNFLRIIYEQYKQRGGSKKKLHNACIEIGIDELHHDNANSKKYKRHKEFYLKEAQDERDSVVLDLERLALLKECVSYYEEKYSPASCRSYHYHIEMKYWNELHSDATNVDMKYTSQMIVIAIVYGMLKMQGLKLNKSHRQLLEKTKEGYKEWVNE